MKNYMNGKLVDGKGKKFTVYNPENGEAITDITGIDKKQTEEVLAAAQAAFITWSALSLNKREKYILKFVNVIEAHKDKIVEMLIEETGKTYGNAIEDYQMLPDCLRYFISEAKAQKDEMIPDYDNKHINMIIKKPRGVIVGYLAWNFPLLNVGYKLGPVLASGCTCILKPSSQTPITTLYIGELAIEAGIPAGVVNIITGDNSVVGTVLNESTIPQMITLIGSSFTGKKIMQQAATSIKYYSLELGGNAPVIVAADADVEKAATCVVNGKTGNAGQVCVAPNRVFVHKHIKEKFIKKAVEMLSNITYGSGKPQGEGLYMQPMSSMKAVENMEELVKDAVEKGATVLSGGKKADRAGYFFEPTLLTGVTKEMRVYKEEIFGPIIPVIEMDDTDDLKALANDTEYGLAAYLYTTSLNMGLSLSREIDAGTVCVNEPFFCYNLPHGGCKQSGIGKDCSTFSLEEYYFVQRISIVIE
ncbi:aldehyde dehydrogenase family protein [Faecalicatena contorta]|uniref:aldehyde dehydrogenase family protein n=1 Tax=Faecalicatena contorta TaxID=39482 RepID=UPI00129E3B7E|nr:aldehyde dehydrogenase family protein [Faecalicatena contorta]MRM88997.1 aldehyde dehydrogenase family protein [Faecalicatena contorta]